jgi:hypothetical protein
MAGLEEQAQWESEIYQIETTDPVVGGPPDLAQGQGITNVPHKLLANRTAWLKAQVDSLVAAGYVTQVEIDAAINSLIAGAPAALDTLKELADELSDNDDAIAALTSQIAAKLNAASYTAEDVRQKLLLVDGSGSRIDSDLLDGLEGQHYRNASNLNAGTVPYDRLPISTLSQAAAGSDDKTVMTPHRVAHAITHRVILAAAYFTLSGSTLTFQWGRNVSSVTRQGVGQYTVNFTSAINASRAYALVNLNDSGGYSGRLSGVTGHANNLTSNNLRVYSNYKTTTELREADYGTVLVFGVLS